MPQKQPPAPPQKPLPEQPEKKKQLNEVSFDEMMAGLEKADWKKIREDYEKEQGLK